MSRHGMAGVRNAIKRHQRTITLAAMMLVHECGKRHKLGEHSLCPKCEEFNAGKRKTT